LNWTILFKCLEMTIVVIWRYINKTELNWIELKCELIHLAMSGKHQKITWGEKEKIWLRLCSEGLQPCLVLLITEIILSARILSDCQGKTGGGTKAYIYLMDITIKKKCLQLQKNIASFEMKIWQWELWDTR